jgi:hypothetical protein
MTRAARPAFFFALVLAAGVAAAQGEAVKRLAEARSLKCTFGKGTVAVWTPGKLDLKPDSWDVTIHFDGIDHDKGKARMIGNAGSSDVIAGRSGVGVTFVESTGVGAINTTTVFFYESTPGEYIAVTSRHVVSDGPLPSQYHGTCRIWE